MVNFGISKNSNYAQPEPLTQKHSFKKPVPYKKSGPFAFGLCGNPLFVPVGKIPAELVQSER